MELKDVPKHEIETEIYSRKTVSGLLETAKRDYRQFIRKSAAKNVPLIIGSYIVVCACLAGYSLAHGESIWLFSKIYVALVWLWIPVATMLPIQWFFHRPTESTVREELGWYRELSKSATLEA